LDGTDLDDAAATAEVRHEQEQHERRSDRSLDALAFVNQREEPFTAHDLAARLKISPKVAGNLLMRLHTAGLIDHPARGLYERKQQW
jgi:Mn-dependent DtxR family transcriptional regulator